MGRLLQTESTFDSDSYVEVPNPVIRDLHTDCLLTANQIEDGQFTTD